MQSVLVSRRLWWSLAAAVGVVALAASGIGIVNDFAYDDQFVIVHNTAIDALPRWWKMFTWSYWPKVLGGDGYRPLTILGFSIQWALGGGKPMLFHAVNIAVYTIASIGVFWLASQFLPIAYAAIAGAIFAAHPVHVESVANVVGQSEVMVGALVVLTVALFVRWRNADILDGKRMAALALMYFTSCFYKENAIVAPALLLAAELVVVDAPGTLVERLRRCRPLWLALAALGLLYLLIRSKVLPSFSGFALFVPFEVEKVTHWQRVVTMVGLVPVWVRLFLWPAHLQTEYGPPEYEMAGGASAAQLPGLLLLLGTLGLMVVLRRREPVIAFGIAWVVIALLPVSNFLIPTGILIAERTLFLPSVGVALAIAGAMPAIGERISTPVLRRVAFAGVLLVIAAGTARSLTRTQVWRSNDSLFRTGVIDAPNSYRSHYLLGGLHFSSKRPNSGAKELLIALEMYPIEPFVAFNLGEEYRHAGLYDAAAKMFARTLHLIPRFKDALGRMAIVQANMGNFEEARRYALEAIQEGNSEKDLMHQIVLAAAAHRRGEDSVGSRKLPEPAQIAPPGAIGRGRDK